MPAKPRPRRQAHTPSSLTIGEAYAPPPVITRENPDGSLTVEWRSGEDQDSKIGELRVWFDPDTAEVRTVQLHLVEGLTPTALQRFPWNHWLTIADAHMRLHRWTSPDGAFRPEGDWGRIIDRLHGTAFTDHPPVRAPKRPGRRGHPDEFYQSIAALYLEHRAAGHTDPTAMIAKHPSYMVERSTAAGWVRRARELGHLPPARRGRPG